MSSDPPHFYRLYAAHCVEIARQVTSPNSRAALLTMAQAWLVLADQADKNRGAPTVIYETPPRSPQQPFQQQPRPGKK